MSSTIYPRHGEDAYPIGRFILDRARELGINRTELVQRLGYGNLGKGHRALTQALLTGIVQAYIAQHLAAAMIIEQSVIDEVITATNLH